MVALLQIKVLHWSSGGGMEEMCEIDILGNFTDEIRSKNKTVLILRVSYHSLIKLTCYHDWTLVLKKLTEY